MSLKINTFWYLNGHLGGITVEFDLSELMLKFAVQVDHLTTCPHTLWLLFCSVFPLQAKPRWGLTPGSTPCPCPRLPPPPLRHCPPPRPLSPATGRVLPPSAPPRGSWAGTRGTATWTTMSTWRRWAGYLPRSCKYTHCSLLRANFLRRWSQFHQMMGLKRWEHTVCTQRTQCFLI